MNLLQVHISLLSDDYVEDPFEVVKVGDEAPGPWRCRIIKGSIKVAKRCEQAMWGFVDATVQKSDPNDKKHLIRN